MDETAIQKRVLALSPMQAYILRSLLKLNSSHGWGVVKEVNSLNEVVPISSRINVPSVYKSLENLVRNGLVSSRVNDEMGDKGRVRGRLYSITVEGRRVLTEYSIFLDSVRQLLDS